MCLQSTSLCYGHIWIAQGVRKEKGGSECQCTGVNKQPQFFSLIRFWWGAQAKPAQLCFCFAPPRTPRKSMVFWHQGSRPHPPCPPIWPHLLRIWGLHFLAGNGGTGLYSRRHSCSPSLAPSPMSHIRACMHKALLFTAEKLPGSTGQYRRVTASETACVFTLPPTQEHMQMLIPSVLLTGYKKIRADFRLSFSKLLRTTQLLQGVGSNEHSHSTACWVCI